MTKSSDTLVVLSAGRHRADVLQRGRGLQYVTIAWNSVECLIALLAGVFAGSIALVGFGLDSAIEVTSSLAAIWRLHRDDEQGRRIAEERSLRVIGICFLLLAVYVLYEASVTLVEHEPPRHSLVGIILAALSLVVMPWLAHLKRKVAISLESGALEAETRQTEVCAYLSGILLLGLGLNAWLDWWWADPVAGIVMVPLIAWEGWEAIRGRTCCPH